VRSAISATMLVLILTINSTALARAFRSCRHPTPVAGACEWGVPPASKAHLDERTRYRDGCLEGTPPVDPNLMSAWQRHALRPETPR